VFREADCTVGTDASSRDHAGLVAEDVVLYMNLASLFEARDPKTYGNDVEKPDDDS
jgi:hypothetical protein